MQRMSFLNRALLWSSCLLALVALRPALAQPGGQGRPHLVYIFTDQQWAGAMSCAGNGDLATPVLDGLAARGVRFENAYCTQPLCVPSRTAMVTGVYPHEIAATHNTLSWPRAPVPMLGKLLAEAGYECAWFGKWHIPVAPALSAEHGFATVECDKGSATDEKLADACQRFLSRPHDRPLFLVASFLNPHNICEWARGQPTPQGPIPPPPPPEQCPALPLNFEVPFDEPEVVRSIQARHAPGYPTTGWAPERWRQYRWAYYRLVEKVDAQIGRFLEVLRAQGLADNTLIVFSSDHGDGNAAHRWNQKQVLYDESARVPLIVCLPGTTAGRVDRSLVNAGLDLYPTLCDYARLPLPGHLRGRSLRPLLEQTQPAAWRNELVCETEFANNAGGMGITGRALRTQRYKYICYSQGQRREQLFDLEKDPGETLNLAAVPEMAAVLQDHRRRLADWCRQTADRFPVPGETESH